MAVRAVESLTDSIDSIPLRWGLTVIGLHLVPARLNTLVACPAYFMSELCVFLSSLRLKVFRVLITKECRGVSLHDVCLGECRCRVFMRSEPAALTALVT